MIEKPNLPDQAIIACLRDHYSIHAAAVIFLPLGYDATAWVYRADTADGAYFLKLKKGLLSPSALSVPHYLRDQGIQAVVAPLPTRAGALAQPLDDFNLIVYPFIDGATGMDQGMTELQWIQFGWLLKTIHATQLPPGLIAQLQPETFIPKWSAMVRRLDATIQAGGYRDRYQRELADFWLAKQAQILRMTGRAEELGHALQQRRPPFVLCHTDIHTANILLDASGALHIVDWDQPLLAPIERDLFFVAGLESGWMVIDSPQQVWFFEGYGRTEIDPLALSYYQYEWVVQEIGDFGERVFFATDSGEATQAASVQEFMRLFAPGDVVEAAIRGDGQG